MEIYKTIKTVQIQNGPKKEILVSNKGNIKLHYFNKYIDEYYILKLGKGLYINHLSTIGGYHLFKEPIYRIIYRLFVGDIPKGFQIHHKDFNRLNNSIDNLECLSPIEHGYRHKWQRLIPTSDNYKEKYKREIELYDNYLLLLFNYKYVTIDSSKEYITNIENDIKERTKVLSKEYKDNQKELTKEKNNKKIDQIRKDKLESGDYKLNDNGRLVKINKPKWTEDRRKKTLESQKYVRENTEWRQHIKDKVNEYYDTHPEAGEEISIKNKNYYDTHPEAKERLRKQALERWETGVFKRKNKKLIIL